MRQQTGQGMRSGGRGWSGPPPRFGAPFSRTAGVTLVELLAVIGILVTLMGLGAYTYIRMSRSYTAQGAAQQMDVTIRRARSAAVGSNAPAFVEINTDRKQLTPWVYRNVAMWHFEDLNDYGQSRGAYHDATLRGGVKWNDGKTGKCVRLTENSYVDAGSDPDFDLDDGGLIECYIQPLVNSFTGDHYIFNKNRAYSLWIKQGGKLCGQVGSGTVVAESYRIAPRRWTKVALAWDRNSIRLIIDEAIVAVGPGAETPINNSPFLVGHESANMLGLVDEVRVMGAARDEPLQLPPNVQIEHTAQPWSAIYFASDGTLDPRYHPGPVSITLTQDRKARTVRVTMLGQTSREEVEQKVVSEEEAPPTDDKPRRSEKEKLTVYTEEKKEDTPKAGNGSAPAKSQVPLGGSSP